MSALDAVHRFYQVYNDRDVNLWDQVMAPTYVGHVNGQTIANREIGKGFVEAILHAFPDIRYTIDDSLGVGGRVAVRWSAVATHTGDLLGMAPTGKSVSIIGMTIFRVEDGQIVELWDVWDEAGLLRQLESTE
ncbi:MAG TPA: ester cyclase [Vicinamibacterales bacterium]|nr:ester cyclase [Vicinamibacterales bacterium]